MEPGDGERLHNERRKRLWRTIGILGGAGAIGGFISGFVMGHNEARSQDIPDAWRTVAAAGLIIGAIVAAYGSWRFFKVVDEVEVADNLWGSMIGYYVYALTLPTWFALAWLDRAPPVDHWVIFFASMAAALAVYGWRKWQAR
jgi:hypothetical protein